MSAAIDTVLARLEGYKLHPVGPDRWRCVCPVCGERNANTLSIGVTTEGAVLLRCFKTECDAESICRALGLEITNLFPAREAHAGPVKRRRMLTAQQALDLLADESLIVFIVGSDMHKNKAISAVDHARLRTAVSRIQFLHGEAGK